MVFWWSFNNKKNAQFCQSVCLNCRPNGIGAAVLWDNEGQRMVIWISWSVVVLYLLVCCLYLHGSFPTPWPLWFKVGESMENFEDVFVFVFSFAWVIYCFQWNFIEISWAVPRACLCLEIVYKWMTELVVIVSVVVCLLCCWCVSICTHASFCKQNLRVQLSSGDL